MNQRINEVIKAFSYGETLEQIAAAEGITVEEARQVQRDFESEIEEEKVMLRKAGYLDG